LSSLLATNCQSIHVLGLPSSFSSRFDIAENQQPITLETFSLDAAFWCGWRLLPPHQNLDNAIQDNNNNKMKTEKGKRQLTSEAKEMS
jgi:hypothetical protein